MFHIKHTTASFKTQQNLEGETFPLTDTEQSPKGDYLSVLKTYISISIDEKTQHFLKVIILQQM